MDFQNRGSLYLFFEKAFCRARNEHNSCSQHCHCAKGIGSFPSSAYRIYRFLVGFGFVKFPGARPCLLDIGFAARGFPILFQTVKSITATFFDLLIPLRYRGLPLATGTMPVGTVRIIGCHAFIAFAVAEGFFIAIIAIGCRFGDPVGEEPIFHRFVFHVGEPTPFCALLILQYMHERLFYSVFWLVEIDCDDKSADVIARNGIIVIFCTSLAPSNFIPTTA